MTTSKIETVSGVKPYNGQNGTVYYHRLIMNNGDKIDIGKKKQLEPGNVLTYEIIGDKKQDGTYQHEYPKAKTVSQQNTMKDKHRGPKGSNASFALAYAKDMAVAHIEKGNDFMAEQVLTVATKFNNWLNENS